MEITIRTNEVKLARMQECLSALQKKGIGFAGKYIDHETYLTKHATGHNPDYREIYLEHDTTDKLERINTERECAKDFEVLSLDIAKTANAKEMQRLQTMVFCAIEACIIKGHLNEAENLVRHISEGEYENSRNKIGCKDTVVRHYLKAIIKGYAKMTRQCIKRPDEMVFSKIGPSERNQETLTQETRALFQEWQEKHPSTRSVLTNDELRKIANKEPLSALTLSRLELNEKMQKVIDKHRPFSNYAQKLMTEIFNGKFGEELKENEIFYIELSQIYNHYLASGNPARDNAYYGELTDAKEEIRKYANAQRLKSTPPTLEKTK